MKRYTASLNGITYPCIEIVINGTAYHIKTIGQGRANNVHLTNAPGDNLLFYPESFIVTATRADIVAAMVLQNILPADFIDVAAIPGEVSDREILTCIQAPAAPPANCITVRLPDLRECDINIEATNDNSAPDFEDTDLNKQVLTRARRNVWAWCVIAVTVSYRGFKAVDYLGGCSYSSEKDFKDNSGYYGDMVQTCYTSLIEQLKALAI